MPLGFCILKTQPNSIESGIIKKIASEKTLAMTSRRTRNDKLGPFGTRRLSITTPFVIASASACHCKASACHCEGLPLVIARAFSEAIS